MWMCVLINYLSPLSGLEHLEFCIQVHIYLCVERAFKACTMYGICFQSLLAIVLLSGVVSVIYESTNHVMPASTHNDHERNPTRRW